MSGDATQARVANGEAIHAHAPAIAIAFVGMSIALYELTVVRAFVPVGWLMACATVAALATLMPSGAELGIVAAGMVGFVLPRLDPHPLRVLPVYATLTWDDLILVGGLLTYLVGHYRVTMIRRRQTARAPEARQFAWLIAMPLATLASLAALVVTAPEEGAGGDLGVSEGALHGIAFLWLVGGVTAALRALVAGFRRWRRDPLAARVIVNDAAVSEMRREAKLLARSVQAAAERSRRLNNRAIKNAPIAAPTKSAKASDATASRPGTKD